MFGILDARKLAFDRSAGRGIVVTGEDAAGSGHLEYLSIAPSRAEAMRLEAEFEALLGAEADPQSESGIEHLARILSHMPQVRRTEPEQARARSSPPGTAHQPGIEASAQLTRRASFCCDYFTIRSYLATVDESRYIYPISIGTWTT